MIGHWMQRLASAKWDAYVTESLCNSSGKQRCCCTRVQLRSQLRSPGRALPGAEHAHVGQPPSLIGSQRRQQLDGTTTLTSESTTLACQAFCMSFGSSNSNFWTTSRDLGKLPGSGSRLTSTKVSVCSLSRGTLEISGPRRRPQLTSLEESLSSPRISHSNETRGKNEAPPSRQCWSRRARSFKLFAEEFEDSPLGAVCFHFPSAPTLMLLSEDTSVPIISRRGVDKPCVAYRGGGAKAGHPCAGSNAS